MEKCANRDHLDSALAETEKRGGEGLMLRCPGSKYEHRRSKSLLLYCPQELFLMFIIVIV